MTKPTDSISDDHGKSVYRRLLMEAHLGAWDPIWSTPPFKGMPKIPRFFRDCIITEKIDGTNAQIVIQGRNIWGHFYAHTMQAGSKKQYITPENDNFGFAAWVQEHADELRLLGPGCHRGEWWGRGINRGYDLDHRRFSLFNVHRWCNWMAPSPRPEIWFDGCHKRRPCPPCCHVVPVLFAGPFHHSAVIEGCLQGLQGSGSYAAPGYAHPEGIVVYHQAGKCLFKVTLKNDGLPKSVLRKQSMMTLKQERRNGS